MANHENRSNERVTIVNLRGERERVTLPKPHWEGKEKYATGVTIEALYKGRNTGRLFMRTYSIWQRQGGHEIEGTTYTELDLDAYLIACERADAEPQVDAKEV